MELIKFSNSGLNMVFVIDDKKQIGLKFLSTDKAPEEISEENITSYPLTEVKATGFGCERMGAKAIGGVCPDRLLYDSHKEEQTEDGRLLKIVLKSKALKVTQNYFIMNGASVLRAFAEVENISGDNVGLELVSSFALTGLGRKGVDGAKKTDLYTPHNMWCEEVHWSKASLFESGMCPFKKQSSKRIQLSNLGSWSTKDHLPMGCLEDSETKSAMMWQIEHNGSWHWELTDVPAGEFCLRLSGPDEHNCGWWKELKPGESFETVKVAVAWSCEGFGGAVRELTKYRRLITRHIVDKNMPFIFNDYMGCLWAQPTTEKEIPVIDKAAEMGAEVYCMDAGWYSEGAWWPLVGEWEECPARFPNGIKEVFDYVYSRGMKPGIWLEPEVMGVDCPLVPEFSDCFVKRHGKNIVDRGRYHLDFRKQKVLDHLNKVVDRFVNEWGIRYIKFDYNIDIGVGTETDATSFGDGLMQCNKAFLDWVDSLYERHPGLTIENCSSGGMRMDYGSLQHFAVESVSDSAYYNEFAYMSAMAPTAVLPEQAGIWVVPAVEQSKGENVFSAVNGLLNRFYLSGKIHLLGQDDFDLIKEGAEVHKSIRKDLVGSMPYFPLGINRFADDWAVAARLSGDGKKLFITAGRLSGDTQINIPLSEIKGKKKNAKIVYPKSYGNPEICLENDILTVTLNEKTAIFVEVEIE